MQFPPSIPSHRLHSLQRLHNNDDDDDRRVEGLPWKRGSSSTNEESNRRYTLLWVEQLLMLLCLKRAFYCCSCCDFFQDCFRTPYDASRKEEERKHREKGMSDVVNFLCEATLWTRVEEDVVLTSGVVCESERLKLWVERMTDQAKRDWWRWRSSGRIRGRHQSDQERKSLSLFSCRLFNLRFTTRPDLMNELLVH